ncbi:serine/arginine repetitive matrix protein 1-like, partial [Ixodes scapularis]|uniref:serine/arginine repetitive matrix protein 1-like n=1 Tax=Ixodes scapularis TaxID=6945 RepID=UPI001A9EDEB0
DFLPTPGTLVMPWLTWKRGFLNYLEATDADGFPSKQRRAILLSFLGEEGNRVVDAFGLAGPAVGAAQVEFQVLLSALDTHFASAQNVVVEHRKFVTRVQGPGETVLEYLGALRRLASFCDYGESLESRVAEMFISGIRNAEVQDRLIRESGGAHAPSLERAVQLAQQFEWTSRDCDLFRRLSLDATPNAPHVVERIQDGRGRDRDAQHGGQPPRRRGSSPPRRERPLPPPPSPSQREPSYSSLPRRGPPSPPSGRARTFPLPPRQDRRQLRAPSRPFSGARPRDPPPGARPPVREGGCFFCGRRSHPRDECPASGATCFLCGREGHFANVCRSRPRGDRDHRQLALPAGRRVSARGYYDRRQAGPTRTPVRGVCTFSEYDEDEMWPGVYTVGSPGGRREQRPGPQRRSFTADVELLPEQPSRDM